MPFYEYQCAACGAQTEVLQKITDAPLKKCPECGKNKLTKLVSAPVFRLKGGGWYETDFKSDKDNKRNLADGDRDKDSGSDKAADKTAEKTADKPAEKPAEKEKPGVKADSKPAAGSGSGAADRKPVRRAAKPAATTSARKPAARPKPARGKARR